MLGISEIQNIMVQFGLSVQVITNFHDTSHSEEDKRLNYILDDKYVLKVNSVTAMWEERLQEISRLIARYQSIGVYCPALIPTLDGRLSYILQKDGKAYTCFVEEYAFPYYKRLIDMFQYPNVCAMTEWLQSESRRMKCVELIQAMLVKPL